MAYQHVIQRQLAEKRRERQKRAERGVPARISGPRAARPGTDSEERDEAERGPAREPESERHAEAQVDEAHEELEKVDEAAEETEPIDLDALRARAEQLQGELQAIGENLGAENERYEGGRTEYDEAAAEMKKTREKTEERKERLAQENQRLQKSGKPAKHPAKDGDLKRLTGELEKDGEEVNEAGEEVGESQESLQGLSEEQERTGTELEAVAKTIEENTPKGGGGGGRAAGGGGAGGAGPAPQRAQEAVVDKLSAEQAAAEAELAGVSAELELLRAQLSANAEQQASVRAELGAARAQLGQLAHSEDEGAEAQAQSVQARIGELEGRLQTLQSQEAELQARLAELERRRAELEAALAALTGEVGGAEDELQEIEQRVDRASLEVKRELKKRHEGETDPNADPGSELPAELQSPEMAPDPATQMRQNGQMGLELPPHLREAQPTDGVAPPDPATQMGLELPPHLREVQPTEAAEPPDPMTPTSRTGQMGLELPPELREVQEGEAEARERERLEAELREQRMSELEEAESEGWWQDRPDWLLPEPTTRGDGKGSGASSESDQREPEGERKKGKGLDTRAKELWKDYRAFSKDVAFDFADQLEGRRQAYREMTSKPVTEAETEVIGAKVRAFESAMAATGHGDGDTVTETLFGMNKREAFVFMKLYNDRLGLTGKKRLKRSDLNDLMAEKLPAADAYEASIHLKGNPVRGAKTRLGGAIADPDFMKKAGEFKGDYLKRRSEAREGLIDKGIGLAVDLYDLENEKYEGLKRVLDDKEVRIQDVMDKLSPSDRRKLMKSRRFQKEIKGNVAEAIEDDPTLAQQWDAFTDTSGLKAARKRVRKKKRAELKRLGVKGDDLKAKMKAYRKSEAYEKDAEAAEDKQIKGEMMAGQIEEALHGTGALSSYRTWGRGFEAINEGIGNTRYANLDTDKQAVNAMLDTFEQDPELYAIAAERWAKTRFEDDSWPRDGHNEKRPAVDLLTEEIQEQTERPDFDPLTLPRKLGEGVRTALEEGRLPKSLTDYNDMQAIGEKEKGAVSGIKLQKLENAKAVDDAYEELEKETKLPLRQSIEAVRGQPLPEEVKDKLIDSMLKEAGGKSDKAAVKLQTLKQLERKKEDLELDERAMKIVAYAKAGEYKGEEGLHAVLQDKEYNDGLREIEDELRHRASLKPERIKALEARKKRLSTEFEERKAKVDAKVAALTGSEGVTDFIDKELWGQEGGDSDLTGPDKKRWAKKMFEKGRLDPHEQVYLAIKGWGTDKPELKAALKGRSPKEIETIAMNFAANFGGELWSITGAGPPEPGDPMAYFRYALEHDVGGLDQYEIDMAVIGDPKAVYDPNAEWAKNMTPKQRRRAARERLEVERARAQRSYGYADNSYFDLDAEGDPRDLDTRIVNQDMRLKQFSIDNDKALKDGDPEAWARYEQLAGYLSDDVAAYDKEQSDLADKVVTGVELVGSLAATIATAGGAAPATVAIMGAAFGAAGLGTEVAIKGEAMDRDVALEKLGKLMLTTGVGFAFDKVKLLKALNENAGLMKGLPKELATQLVALGMDENVLRDGKLPEKLTGAAASAVKATAVDRLTEKVAGEGPKGVHSAHEAGTHAVKETVVKTGLETVSDTDLWKGKTGVDGIIDKVGDLALDSAKAYADAHIKRRGLKAALKKGKYDPEKHGSVSHLHPDDLDAVMEHYTTVDKGGELPDMKPAVVKALYDRLNDPSLPTTDKQKSWLEKEVTKREQIRRVQAEEAARDEVINGPVGGRLLENQAADDPANTEVMEKYAREHLAAAYRDGKLEDDDLKVLQVYAPEVLAADDRDPRLSHLMERPDIRKRLDAGKRRAAYEALSGADQVAFEPDDPRLDAFMQEKARGELAKRYADGRIKPAEMAILKYYAPDLLRSKDRDPDLAYRLDEDDVQVRVQIEARSRARAVLSEAERESLSPEQIDEKLTFKANFEYLQKYKAGRITPEELAVMQVYCPSELHPIHRNPNLRRSTAPTLLSPEAIHRQTDADAGRRLEVPPG